jgi:hypothetical protein
VRRREEKRRKGGRMKRRRRWIKEKEESERLREGESEIQRGETNKSIPGQRDRETKRQKERQT